MVLKTGSVIQLVYSLVLSLGGPTRSTGRLAGKHIDSYSTTKAEGEALVIKSNGVNGLLTCCLRPSGIFGPGDKLFVPSLVSAARAGKLKFIIGDGNNIHDFTYVENVAHANVCAERALASGGETAKKAAGQVVELTYRLFGPYGMKVPQFTPSRMRLISGNRSFDCSKAKECLGYEPLIPLQDGIKRTIESYSDLKAENQPKREGPSKASLFLGRGRDVSPQDVIEQYSANSSCYGLLLSIVADTLLWKDRKQTMTAILILVAIYYNFIASGSTIITAPSKLLLVVSVFLFIHGCLPDKMLGYTVEKIPASHFPLSEEKSHQVAMSFASLWNYAVNVLRSLCKGKDSLLFLKVVFSLLLLSFLGAISLQSLFIMGLPTAFVAFYVYERKEQEIDAMVMGALSTVCKLKSDISRKFLTLKDD
ncbi:hypothetical protein SLEP1_g12793 [Rubroshorea leprosula]|uniref:Reticulon-like protein n=1 Tax=Rubroshorea leprosula TaxID=152421 RepID=A0AAV5IN42_9ROSI|nr:hypothetical protein SLEP1_g12793 [Rubroshorea leprosula]